MKSKNSTKKKRKPISKIQPKCVTLKDKIKVSASQEQTENVLRESEEKFKKLAENFLERLIDTIPNPVFYKDIEGKYRGCNRAFEDYIGITKDKLIGKSDYDIAPKNLADIYFAKDKALLDNPGKQIYESQVQYADGTIHDVVFYRASFEKADSVLGGLVGVMLDITDRKRLEKQLQQSQKIEAVGHLAAGIAHDFNNILTAIIGYANLLQMKMKDDDPLKNSIDQILVLTDRAESLTKNLLTFSSDQTVALEAIDMNEVVLNLEKFLARVIGENIEFKTEISERELPVMADSSQIEQVLMNLSTNARDSMPKGGLLKIKTEMIEMDREFLDKNGYGKEGMYALISISDTGMGMDDLIKESIFEPFFTTKDVGKGTGLGLSVVYGIIKQHNGYINVESEKGKGTTFRIYLPLVKGRYGLGKPSESAAQLGGTETVLVAEDDNEVRSLIKKLLREYGYNVIEAFDGDNAVKKFFENKDSIDLILLDIIMPKKGGKDVYREITASVPNVKAIFMSGYPSYIAFQFDKEALDNAVFVSKPIVPTELLKKIKEVLNK